VALSKRGRLRSRDTELSYRDALRRRPVRILSASRLTVKIASATLSYGIMVYLARQGASQFQISLASSASYLAALLFGLQGGMVADTVPKKRTLMVAFVVQAAICFSIPLFIGTDIAELLLLIFLTNAMAQVIGPGLKSAVALVATPKEMATTSALVSLVGSIGSAIGSAFLAPVLIKFSGINAVLLVTGVFYLLGAIRIRALPVERARSESLWVSLREAGLLPKALSLEYNARWIMEHKPVASMMLVGLLVSAPYEGFETLVPAYVRDVLHADPANSIYIFAPAGIGYFVGTVLGPWLIDKLGERNLAILSVWGVSAGLILLGLIDRVAPWFARFSPFRLLEAVAGVEIDEKVMAAGMIAIPANFSSTVGVAAVQNYINRTVPVEQQGGIFGLQEAQKNAVYLVTVFALGVVSLVVGPRYILVALPFIVLAIVLRLIRYSYTRIEGVEPARGRGFAFLRGQVEGSRARAGRLRRRT
jgi:MFS family permease